MATVEKTTMPLAKHELDQVEKIHAQRREHNALIDSVDRLRYPRLITRLEFIEYFNITPKCEWNWRTAGFLPFVKIGSKVLYDIEDVIEFKNLHKKTIQPK